MYEQDKAASGARAVPRKSWANLLGRLAEAVDRPAASSYNFEIVKDFTDAYRRSPISSTDVTNRGLLARQRNSVTRRSG